MFRRANFVLDRLSQLNAVASMKVLKFELFPGRSLHLLLFEIVENVHNIRDRLLKGEFELALMNTDLVNLPLNFAIIDAQWFEKIFDEFQIGVAANKALASQKSSKMRTKNLHSELIFQLGCQKNVHDHIPISFSRLLI